MSLRVVGSSQGTPKQKMTKRTTTIHATKRRRRIVVSEEVGGEMEEEEFVRLRAERSMVA